MSLIGLLTLHAAAGGWMREGRREAPKAPRGERRGLTPDAANGATVSRERSTSRARSRCFGDIDMSANPACQKAHPEACRLRKK